MGSDLRIRTRIRRYDLQCDTVSSICIETDERQSIVQLEKNAGKSSTFMDVET